MWRSERSGDAEQATDHLSGGESSEQPWSGSVCVCVCDVVVFHWLNGSAWVLVKMFENCSFGLCCRLKTVEARVSEKSL